MLDRARELKGCYESTSWCECPLRVSLVLLVTNLFFLGSRALHFCWCNLTAVDLFTKHEKLNSSMRYFC